MTNLLSMIPRFFQETLEFPEIMKAWEKGLGDFEGNIKGVWDNQYIQTCDEDTLSLYERLLGITPTGDLEYRRMIVLNKYSMAVPFSEGYLRAKLDEMFGPDGYILTIDHINLTATINITTHVAQARLIFLNLWYGIAPAHIAVSASENLESDIDGEQFYGGVFFSTVIHDI